MCKLGRREKIILDRIPGTEHLTILESRYFSERFQLHIFRKRSRKTIYIDLHRIPSLRFHKKLVPVSFCKTVDLIFNTGTISWPGSLYPSLVHRAAFKTGF